MSKPKIADNSELADDLEFDPYLFLSEQLDSEETKASLKRKLNKLGISAREKKTIWGIVDKGIWSGHKFILLGRTVVEVVVNIVSKFPRAACGLVLGLTLQALISAIPFLGVFLGPSLGTLAIGIMVVGGALFDLKSRILGLVEHGVGPLKAAFEQA